MLLIFQLKKTCEWLNETKKRLGERAVWILGNHDVSYMATFIPNSFKIRVTDFEVCSGWTRNKASSVNLNLCPDFFEDLELAIMANGYVCVHGGFHEKHFRPFMTALESVEYLNHKWHREKQFMASNIYSWINDIGKCRKGKSDVGSPIWLDWEHEFRPITGIKQIVGHTANFKNKGWPEKQGNYCIDSCQSIYAVTTPNFKIELKHLTN